MAGKSFQIGWLYLDLSEDWLDLFDECNWYDFNFIKLAVENHVTFGNFEIDLALIGFNARMTVHYADTEAAEEIKRKVEMLGL